MLYDLIRLVELKTKFDNNYYSIDEQIEYNNIIRKLLIRFPKLEYQEEYIKYRRDLYEKPKCKTRKNDFKKVF